MTSGSDWVCADGYNWYPDPGRSYQSFEEKFRVFHDWAVARGKPAMAGEYASQEMEPGRRATWINEARASLKTRLTGILAVVYFHSYSSEHDWQLTSEPDALTAFSAMGLDRYNFNPWPEPAENLTSTILEAAGVDVPKGDADADEDAVKDAWTDQTASDESATNDSAAAPFAKTDNINESDDAIEVTDHADLGSADEDNKGSTTEPGPEQSTGSWSAPRPARAGARQTRTTARPTRTTARPTRTTSVPTRPRAAGRTAAARGVGPLSARKRRAAALPFPFSGRGSPTRTTATGHPA